MISYLIGKIFNENNANDLSKINQYSFFQNSQLVQAVVSKPITTTELSSNLSTNNHNLLRRFKRRAFQLDNLFKIFGFEVGLNAVLSMIPVMGIFINLFNSLLIYSLVFQLDVGLPLFVHFKLLLNICIEFVSNFFPIVGQVFNASYKANTRNSNVLIHHLNNLSDANYKSLLSYIDYENRNNVDNVQFQRGAHRSSISTNNSSSSESVSTRVSRNHNLTHNDKYFELQPSSGMDLQESLIRHSRKLSNHTIFDSDKSSIFKK